ncbi:Fur family transcriptional regulator [Exiguobacterium profundum]|uniref:Fur family transcriptional regulator n=1 Tax=Exiguobacterium profundum TaxID=307643 RepID=UPI00391A0EB7
MGSEMLDHAVQSLREHGVRMTPQRQAILEYLVTEHSHPTADDIYKALSARFPNMSVASSRFDFVTSRHYHIICDACGKVVDFNYPVLDEIESVASQLTGFKVDRHRLEVYGTCPACQAEQAHKH